MIQNPSSHLEPLANDPAFVQARLTLERCIREFQQRHCFNNQSQPNTPTSLPVQLAPTMNQCFCMCSSTGGSGQCPCKFPDSFQSVISSEWLPTQLVVNMLRQMFQVNQVGRLQPLEFRYCSGIQDPSNSTTQQFLHQIQMNQQGNADLVQCVPGPGQINLTPNYFQLILDVSGIRPDELSVAVMGRSVLVGAERKGRVTGVAHQEAVLRRYELPMTADADRAQCSLTTDGLLHITAPWRDSESII